MTIKIKNWKKFQHFKDRSPPWIKLHRNILDKSTVMTLSDRNFKMLVCLWLLASEDKTLNGTLPSVEDILYRLRPIKKDYLLSRLRDLDNFLIQDDIIVTSGGYCSDIPETETETETETEKRQSRDRVERPAKKRATTLPDDWQPNDKHRSLALEHNIDIATEADVFRDYSLSKGWTKVDWNATFRNWIRRASGFKQGERLTAAEQLSKRNKAAVKAFLEEE